MTTSNEQEVHDEPAPPKMPLMKRILIFTHSLKGPKLIVFGVAFLLLVGLIVGSFLGGLAAATKTNQAGMQNLIAQIKASKLSEAKLMGEKAELEEAIVKFKEMDEVQIKDMEVLKSTIERDKIEREAMNKVFEEIRNSLTAKGADTSKADQAVKGALLKFGERECEMKGDTVSTKDQVKCLNLREAIDAMNTKGKPAEATPAPPVPPKKGH